MRQSASGLDAVGALAESMERATKGADSRARGGFVSQPYEASRTQPVASAEARQAEDGLLSKRERRRDDETTA